MSAISPIIHALFVVADQMDRVIDEMPETVCKDQRLMREYRPRWRHVAGVAA